MKSLRAVIIAAVFLTALALPVEPVRACNVCLEDKIAATYDWQVVANARRTGHQVVFVAIQGNVAPRDEALTRRLVHQLGTVPGVDVGTVRVSLAPPAASFACDPGHHPPAQVVATMNRALRPQGLMLAIVRVGAPGGNASAAR
jgi:hypothetical protein